MAIKIITDSASDINKETAKLLGIELISMEISIDQKVYLDGDNITLDEFYNKLESSKELPRTSQINPNRFISLFDKIISDNDQAIVILVSSKLSGTYQNAKLLEQNYYGNIYVLDSLNAALGEKLLVLYALKLIKENKSFKEIIDLLEEEKNNIVFLARLDTLKYLRKGGRISPLVAIAGEALNIKPIIGIVSGAVKLIDSVRGIEKSKRVIANLIKENNGINEKLPYGVVYSGNDDTMIKDYFSDQQIINKGIEKLNIYQLGCTIGTHIGPNGVGIAFFKNK